MNENEIKEIPGVLTIAAADEIQAVKILTMKQKHVEQIPERPSFHAGDIIIGIVESYQIIVREKESGRLVWFSAPDYRLELMSILKPTRPDHSYKELAAEAEIIIEAIPQIFED